MSLPRHYPDSASRFVCKQCGAQSPTGIGYVVNEAAGVTITADIPEVGCPNFHVVDGEVVEGDGAPALLAHPTADLRTLGAPVRRVAYLRPSRRRWHLGRDYSLVREIATGREFPVRNDLLMIEVAS